jgi:hypothetical protein
MSDSDERMLEGDSPEVITKTGNTTTEEDVFLNCIFGSGVYDSVM